MTNYLSSTVFIILREIQILCHMEEMKLDNNLDNIISYKCARKYFELVI